MADTFIDDLDWLPDELITSTKLNQWWANMQNFHNGTALGDGIIVTRHLGGSAQLKIPADNINSTTFYEGVDANGWMVSLRPDGMKEYSKVISTGSAISLASGTTTEYSFGSGPVGVNPNAAKVAHLSCWGTGTSGEAFALAFRLRVVDAVAGGVFVKVTNPYNTTTGTAGAVRFTATLVI